MGEESLFTVSSFVVVDSSVPFRPADPTRKVKHIMHYGGSQQKRGFQNKRENKIKLSWSSLFQISEHCFSFFAKPPQDKVPMHL